MLSSVFSEVPPVTITMVTGTPTGATSGNDIPQNISNMGWSTGVAT